MRQPEAVGVVLPDGDYQTGFLPKSRIPKNLVTDLKRNFNVGKEVKVGAPPWYHPCRLLDKVYILHYLTGHLPELKCLGRGEVLVFPARQAHPVDARA